MDLPNWDTVRVQEKSLIPEVDLLYAEFKDEEYIHTEADEGLAVMWSASKSLSETIRTARNHIGKSVSDDTLWSRVAYKDASSDEMNPARIEAEALRREEEVMYFTGAFGKGEGLLSWRTPRVKMRDGKVPYAEICYTETSPRLEVLLKLIGSTATPHVMAAIKKDPEPLAQKIKLSL